MFRAEEIEKLDRSYFNIILAEEYDVTIQSKNTGHIWLKNSSAVKLPSVAAASFSDTAIRDCDWRSVSLWVFPKRTEIGRAHV